MMRPHHFTYTIAKVKKVCFKKVPTEVGTEGARLGWLTDRCRWVGDYFLVLFFARHEAKQGGDGEKRDQPNYRVLVFYSHSFSFSFTISGVRPVSPRHRR